MLSMLGPVHSHACQASKMEGCGIFHADLYQLAMHEERCKGSTISERRTSSRHCLTASAEASMPPFVIIIVRSSAERPKVWKAGTNSFEEGLPVLGQKILALYAAWSGFSGGSAVLHACYDCPKRYLPSATMDTGFLEMTSIHPRSTLPNLAASRHEEQEQHP